MIKAISLDANNAEAESEAEPPARTAAESGPAGPSEFGQHQQQRATRLRQSYPPSVEADSDEDDVDDDSEGHEEDDAVLSAAAAAAVPAAQASTSKSCSVKPNVSPDRRHLTRVTLRLVSSCW